MISFPISSWHLRNVSSALGRYGSAAVSNPPLFIH